MATRYPFHFSRGTLPFLRVFGVRSADDAYVDLDETTFEAHFGRFSATTPLANIASWRIEGPWRWITSIGVRRSIRHGDLTFGSSTRGGVRIDLHARIRVSPFDIPALYVSVDDAEGLATALSELGVPGEDRRMTTPDG